MANLNKQKYYRDNRETRLAYQKGYYERYKLRRPRLKELAELLEPEQVDALKRARSEYNQKYYSVNRDRIRKQRKSLALKRIYSHPKQDS
jgi:hypothetical protein